MDGIILMVADAGGTGTDWWLHKPASGDSRFFRTEGINASVSTSEDIVNVLKTVSGEINHFVPESDHKSIICYFYGAGCNSESTKNRLESAFTETFVHDSVRLKITSDLQGAAVALFGDEMGIACILGTGSASGVFDGRHLSDSIPSLGYILGDEGSGAFMGRQLVNMYFKRELDEEVRKSLERFTDMSQKEVLRCVYRSSCPNKYLASFVQFIKEHEKVESISNLINNSLKLFFEKNVLKYSCFREYRVGFVGGVACAFRDRLEAIGASYGLTVEKFISRPIDSLSRYYEERYRL